MVSKPPACLWWPGQQRGRRTSQQLHLEHSAFPQSLPVGTRAPSHLALYNARPTHKLCNHMDNYTSRGTFTLLCICIFRRLHSVQEDKLFFIVSAWRVKYWSTGKKWERTRCPKRCSEVFIHIFSMKINRMTLRTLTRWRCWHSLSASALVLVTFPAPGGLSLQYRGSEEKSHTPSSVRMEQKVVFAVDNGGQSQLCTDVIQLTDNHGFIFQICVKGICW